MKLSVVILNYNVRYFLELCIKSVQAAITDLDAEIIVIDNNSPDESCVMMKHLFPDVKLIENRENVGFAKANNQAVAEAKGEYLCILNPDTVVAEDTFKKLLIYADSLPDLGILGCQLIDGSGRFLPESKRNIPVVKVAAQKLFGNNAHYYANHVAQNQNGKVDVLVGAFMLIKKDIYDAVGGFDEDYFMYGEDIDLSYKILKAGYQNYFCGETTVIHFKGESTRKDKKYAERFYGAMQLFYKKHFKTNAFFDVVIKLGLKIAFLLRTSPKPIKEEVEKYYLVADAMNKTLVATLDKPVEHLDDFENLQSSSGVIFDANSMSYNSIITRMAELQGRDLSFKICPQNGKFILGSDDSVHQGEVILFNEN